MDTKIALIGIIVESPEAAGSVNTLLHEYSSYIVGRMGIPYSKKEVNIISIVIDAPENVISALSEYVPVCRQPPLRVRLLQAASL